MYRWRCPSYLEDPQSSSYALIMLQTAVGISKDEFSRLWDNAVIRVCADGAANQLLEYYSSVIPDLICGDLDSVHDVTLEHYRFLECDVKRDTCQDSTDFTKCVRELFRQRATGKIKFDTILVLCSTDGRLDHILAIVQTLYLTHRMEPDTAIVLVCSNSLSFLMQPGEHVINVKSNLRGDWCGLIPIGQPCESVTTSGLKWNLSNQRLAFGELISTSNTFTDEEEVRVETDGQLLWTMGIKLTEG
eukprot:m.90370 g.90370  ORF g.90370 m.90370 type:complete len:246 (+) comp36644_c0_seq3:12-749(+)